MRVAFVCAVVGAVGLHVAVILALGAPAAPDLMNKSSADRQASDAVWVHAIRTSASPVHATAMPQDVSSRSRMPTDDSVRHLSLPNESGVSAASLAKNGNSYFESAALDQTAEPVGEWSIDTSLLPMTGKSTFQISIWVSARGEIEKWEAKSLSLDEDLTTAIFARLNDTVMNPGRIGEKPVASVLRFELSAERQ